MTNSQDDPEQRLEAFIAKFSTADQERIRAVREALRRRLPTAHEIVYDNHNFFVIGYSGTERPSDAILSIAARAGKIALCLLQGSTLPDPHRILRGDGKQTRSIALHAAAHRLRSGCRGDERVRSVARARPASPDRTRDTDHQVGVSEAAPRQKALGQK